MKSIILQLKTALRVFNRLSKEDRVLVIASLIVFPLVVYIASHKIQKDNGAGQYISQADKVIINLMEAKDERK